MAEVITVAESICVAKNETSNGKKREEELDEDEISAELFNLQKKTKLQLCPPKDAQQSGKESYRAEFSQVENMFANWTQEQKVAALWKLVVHQLKGPEERWALLNRLEHSMKCDPMEYLPVELGVYVLSFLEKRELGRAAQVSTTWKQLAYDPTLPLQKFQPGNIYCLDCNTFLGCEKDIISRKYRLDYSLAYNMKSLCNITVETSEKLSPVTGPYSVARISCKTCNRKIGVKYMSAVPPAPTDKVGTLLVKKKTLYFPGEPAHRVSLLCKKCNSDVAKDQDILDWNYMLRGGEAYLLSSMHSVFLGTPTKVNYSTGIYTVADCLCCTCNENLGVKYIEAPSGKNAFKIGAYLIEKPKLKIVSGEAAKPNNDSSEKKKQKLNKRSSGLFSVVSCFLKRKE